MKPSIPPVLITFALVCFALVQNTQAVSPPPDGGYVGGNTAEGQTALFSLTSGGYKTAGGFFFLRSNTTGRFNTAAGGGARPSTPPANPKPAPGTTATAPAAPFNNTPRL